MTHRILPVHEWPRLKGTPLGDELNQLALHEHGAPGLVVIVVEDDQGRIRGHWTGFVALHAEQVWVRDDDRKKAAVVRHLLKAQAEFAATLGASHYITHSASPEVTRLLVGADGESGLGATRLPGEPYSVPVRKE